MRTSRTALVALAAVLTLGGTTACERKDTAQDTGQTNQATEAGRADALSIVAGSEQKQVVEDVVKPWCQQNGITCTVAYKGSVDQARLVQKADPASPYDVYWFASSVWKQMGDTSGTLQDVKPTSITPVVFAGWKPEMARLGLTGGKDVTVADIATIVERDQATWITNPTQSNSGATAYFSFLNAYAGNKPGVPLTQAQLDSQPVQDKVKKLVQAFDTTPPSTGMLMDACVEAPERCKTLFTYEDMVIEYNKKLTAAGKDPLYAVYPKGALAISDAPIGFFPRGGEAEAAKKTSYDKLVAFLTSEDTQNRLKEHGRRPVASIGLDVPDAPKDTFNPDWGIKTSLKEQPITFPASPVIESALAGYQTSLRLPAETAYCIDGSGSMSANTGWDGVKRANDALFDPEQAKANLLQMNPEDVTHVMIFSNEISGGPWTVQGNDPAKVRDLHDKISAANPGGGTGLYACLQQAANKVPQGTHERRSLVIALTDGMDTEGGEAEAVAALKVKQVPVVTIGFGSDIDKAALERLAEQTGGASFTGGSTPDDVAVALRQATAYK